MRITKKKKKIICVLVREAKLHRVKPLKSHVCWLQYLCLSICCWGLNLNSFIQFFFYHFCFLFVVINIRSPSASASATASALTSPFIVSIYNGSNTQKLMIFLELQLHRYLHSYLLAHTKGRLWQTRLINEN